MKDSVKDIVQGVTELQQEETSQEPVQKEETAQENPNTEDSSLHDETAPVEEQDTTQATDTPSEEISQEQTETAESSEATATEMQPEESEKTEKKTLSPDEFVDYIFSETEGDDELREALLSKFGVSKDPFANEQVAQLNKFIQDTGRSVDDYYRIQALDVENMDAKTAVLHSMALENPDMTSDEINLLFEDSYNLDEDEYSEREIAVAKAKLKRDGNKAIDTLSNLKSEWQKPLPQQQSQQQEVQPYLPENFGEVFKSQVSDIESFEFSVNDKGDVFEYKIDDKYGESVKPIDPQDPLGRYRDEKGNINASRMADEFALIDNIDSIIKSVWQQALGKGQKSTVVDKKNLNINQENRPPETPKPTKQQEQTRKALDKLL